MSLDNQQFKLKLRQQGLRYSKTKQAVFDELLAAAGPLSIQDLVKLLQPQIHFVSVYRAIEQLYKHGFIKQVPQGFKMKYELSDDYKPHHHHVTCEICGLSKSIDNKELEDMLIRLTIESGLQPTKHHFELFGLCAACQLPAS